MEKGTHVNKIALYLITSNRICSLSLIYKGFNLITLDFKNFLININQDFKFLKISYNLIILTYIIDGISF